MTTEISNYEKEQRKQEIRLKRKQVPSIFETFDQYLQTRKILNSIAEDADVMSEYELKRVDWGLEMSGCYESNEFDTEKVNRAKTGLSLLEEYENDRSKIVNDEMHKLIYLYCHAPLHVMREQFHFKYSSSFTPFDYIVPEKLNVSSSTPVYKNIFENENEDLCIGIKCSSGWNVTGLRDKHPIVIKTRLPVLGKLEPPSKTSNIFNKYTDLEDLKELESELQELDDEERFYKSNNIKVFNSEPDKELITSILREEYQKCCEEELKKRVISMSSEMIKAAAIKSIEKYVSTTAFETLLKEQIDKLEK